jgi:methyl-accepting chemotaxis protein
MAYSVTVQTESETGSWKSRLYQRIILLIAASAVICAAVIVFANRTTSEGFLADVNSLLDVAAITLLPYMIAAVVAAITAIAVISLLPALRSVDHTERIIDRLRELNDGNLSSRVRVQGEGQLRNIAGELNQAVTSLAGEISSLKTINRQQWACLCDIRDAVQKRELERALLHIQEMEKNWENLAEIERQLIT